MKRFNAALGATLLTGLIVFSGCGSSEESISREDFITQANEICAESSERIDAAVAELEAQQPTSADFEVLITETVIPAYQGQVDDIRELGTPEGDEEQVDEILGSLDQALVEARENPADLQEGALNEASELAGAYGLDVCGG